MLGSDINLKIAATDKTGAAFRSAESKMKSFAGSAKSLAGALGVGLGATAVTGMIRSAVAYGSAISDAAIATQTNAEALQTFRYLAQQAGAKVEQMDKALITLNKSTYDAANGLSTAKRGFDTLGISVDDFQKLSADQRMEALAKAIVNAKDQNSAMAAAMDLLGSKNAPKLMEALQKLGKEGFGSVAEEAQKAGQVMSEDTMKRLDSAADTIEKFKTAATIKTGETLAFWAQFFEAMRNGVDSVKNVSDEVRVLVDLMKNVSDFWDGFTFIPKKIAGAAGSFIERLPGFPTDLTQPSGNQYSPEQQVMIDSAVKRLENSRKAAAQAPTALDAAPSADPASTKGSGFVLYGDGTGRGFGPAGEQMLAEEIKRTARLNAEVASELRRSNDKAEATLAAVKAGRR